MITNPVPVTSFLDPADLLLPPDILFNSPYKFNTNSWKFNTNRLESNQVAFIDTHTDTFKDKTYVYYHNVGRVFFSSNSLNKKRISLVPADLKSFFNPNIFDTICETSLGINLNVLIQDILRDTINIYNNFTRIPTVGELKSFIASGADEYVVNQLVSSRVESTSVKVFDDYKIPTPLEIDTRNFYFHSNESVNYLSINRVFSKLFELQKTIYDSILSS